MLVGQSFGGPLMLLYAATYPTDVAGMVLVDSGQLNPFRFVNGKLVRFAETATGSPVPPVKTSNPLLESDIPPDARAQIEAAARQSVPTANDPPRDKLPAEAQRMRTWALSQVKHYAAHVNPFEAEEFALLIAEQKKKERPLGDIPSSSSRQANRDTARTNRLSKTLERRTKRHWRPSLARGSRLSPWAVATTFRSRTRNS